MMSETTANAPTIASQQPQGLLEYLNAFWGSFEMQIMVGLLVAGALGMIANYVVKWARGEIAGNLFCYLFVTNVRGTLLAYITYIGAMITAIAMDSFSGANGGFVGWRVVLWFGIVNGFAADAILNKGEKPVWSDEKRAAMAVVKKENTP